MESSIRGLGLEVAPGEIAIDASKEISDEPDPRWPYLSRWRLKSPSSPSVNRACADETSMDEQPLEALASQVDKSSEEDLPAQTSLPHVPVKSISPGEALLPSSPLSSTLKGAWTVPLKLSRRPDSGSTGPNPESHEDAIRFPWAAKMDPSSRNLYRATSPEYMADGTPKVTIPSHVLQQGLENQKEYVLGQFYRCKSPSGGLVHAVVNKIWGRKCKIFVSNQGDSKFLFHIPDASTRAWVLQRGLWHVDDCLMFVAPWSTTDSLEIPDISTVPVWVTLKNIPNRLYSIPGISHIASGLGAPMATYKPRLDPTLMGEAKILVEVELSKAFPPKIAAADKKGFISMVDVEYAWVPTKCGKCGQLGHKASRCASNEITPPSTMLPDPSISDSVLVSEADVAAPTIIKAGPIHSSDKGTLVVANIVVTDVVDEVTNTFQGDKVIPSTNDPVVFSGCPFLAKEISDGNVLGKNQFNALGSSEPVEDELDSDCDSEMMDLMTPSGQRLLRERPVKPSFKAKEMQASSKARGRGSRGRGNRGGRG